MGRRFRATSAAVFCLLAFCATCAAQEYVYDLLERTYAPFTDANDSFGFPLKIKSVSQSPTKFWRGAREHFYVWGKTNCADWLAQADAVMPCQGDPHIGNIGAYLAEGKFPTLAFGMVDFDDSHRLPFQFELLSGVITMRLIAQENRLAMTDSQLDEIVKTILENYTSSTRSKDNATAQLKSDSRIAKMLAADDPYEKVLKRYTEDGKFRATVVNKSGVTKDLLSPTTRPHEDFAKVLAEAVHAKVNIHDVAIRTHLTSGGSQGLRKYLVLARFPLGGIERDVILYLKQQIPSAAERAELIARDPRPAAERRAADVKLLADPQPALCASVALEGNSFTVSIFEPWSSELDSADVKDFDELLRIARIWAIATGATHHQPGQADIVKSHVKDELQLQLKQRSAAYCAQLEIDLEKFKSDPRTIRSAGMIAP